MISPVRLKIIKSMFSLFKKNPFLNLSCLLNKQTKVKKCTRGSVTKAYVDKYGLASGAEINRIYQM